MYCRRVSFPLAGPSDGKNDTASEAADHGGALASGELCIEHRFPINIHYATGLRMNYKVQNT